MMKEVLKSLTDFVFRFETFMFLIVVGFVYSLIAVLRADSERVEQTQQLTEACYSQGMVLVDTDAGQRCADPRTLVKVK